MSSVELPDADSDAITVTPNPATDMVKETVAGSDTEEQVRIISLSGVLMGLHEGTDTFSVASLPAAMYMLKVTTTSGLTRVVKLIKR